LVVHGQAVAVCHADHCQADTVVFDDELSPGQLRSLEKALAGGPNGRAVSADVMTALSLTPHIAAAALCVFQCSPRA
jgi:hypothetical protein